MNTAIIQLEANLEWMTRRSTTSHRWIGVCAPINLAMEADSLDELHEVINESMQELFTDLLRDDELDAFLKEHGWTARNLDSSVRTAEDVRFDVPWQMRTEGTRIDSERCAA